MYAPTECGGFQHVCVLSPGVNVSIQEAEYSVREGDGTVEVCAVLSGETDRPVTIAFSTRESGSAAGML